MFIAMRIARKQYYGGDPERVLQAPTDHVLSLLEFDNFTTEYEEVFLELNKGG